MGSADYFNAIFEPDELLALAQLCKRIDAATVEELSKNADEAYNMVNVIVKMRDVLEELGYVAR